MKKFSELQADLAKLEQQKLDSQEIEQGKLDKNGVPTAVIFQGQGSLEGQDNDKDQDDQPVKKPVAESEDGNWFSKNDNHHVAAHIEHVANKVQQSQTREGLDHHHLFAYTAGSRVVNKEMWSAHHADREPATQVHGFNNTHDIKGLDKAVGRNKLGHDLHVYSGVAFDPEKAAKHHPEGHIHLPAYTSTSVDKDIARNFAANQRNDKSHLGNSEGGKVMGHVMHVHLKKGQAGAFVGNKSNFAHEHEFILPRGTTLKHEHSETHEDNFYDPYRVHHFSVVDK